MCCGRRPSSRRRSSRTSMRRCPLHDRPQRVCPRAIIRYLSLSVRLASVIYLRLRRVHICHVSCDHLRLHFPFGEFLFRGVRYRLRRFVPFNKVSGNNVRCTIRRRFRSVPLAQRNVSTRGGRLLLPSSAANDPGDPYDRAIVRSVCNVSLQGALRGKIRLYLNELLRPSYVFTNGRNRIQVLTSNARGPLVTLSDKDEASGSTRFSCFSTPFRTVNCMVTSNFTWLVVINSSMYNVFVKGCSTICRGRQCSFVRDLLSGQDRDRSFVNYRGRRIGLLPSRMSCVFCLAPTVIVHHAYLCFSSSMRRNFPLCLIVRLIAPNIIATL